MKRRCRCTLSTRAWDILILARMPVNWLLIVYPLPIPASESVATSLHGKMNHLKDILLAHLFCALPFFAHVYVRTDRVSCDEAKIHLTNMT